MLDEVRQIVRSVVLGGDENGVHLFAAQFVGLGEHGRHPDRGV